MKLCKSFRDCEYNIYFNLQTIEEAFFNCAPIEENRF